jgi:hypothetical protein
VLVAHPEEIRQNEIPIEPRMFEPDYPGVPVCGANVAGPMACGFGLIADRVGTKVVAGGFSIALHHDVPVWAED